MQLRPAVDVGTSRVTLGESAASLRMWKERGYFCCRADSMGHTLMLPIHLSDGCSHPSLVAVLICWKARDSTRWWIFAHYLEAAMEALDWGSEFRGDKIAQDHQFLTGYDEIDAIRKEGRGLDTRWEEGQFATDWVCVLLP